MSQRERFQEDVGPRTVERDVNPVTWSRDNAHDTAFPLLAGLTPSTLHSLLSNVYLLQPSDKLLLKWDQIENLQETGTAPTALFKSFSKRAPQVLYPNIVRRAGIAYLELDDGGAVLSKKVIEISVFRSEDTVYFKARLCMHYLQYGLKQRRIERRADDVTKDERVATAVREEDVILVAHETTPLSDSSYLNTSAILSEALMSYCRVYDCPFQEIAEMLETNEAFLDEQVELVLTNLPYNVRRKSRRSSADYDKRTTDDMAAIAMLCGQLMKYGSLNHVFLFQRLDL